MTLKVDDVVWSRDGAPKPAPAIWQRSSMGWHFSDGDTSNRVKMIRPDSSRIEVGHSYIIAIEWEARACSSGEGQWLGLGEGSTVPYVGNTIGAGETEGPDFWRNRDGGTSDIPADS